MDQLINKAADEAEKTDAVEDDISAERPPRQSQSVGTGEWTGADDKHHVEDGRADDRPDADIAVCNEYSDEAREELRGTAAGCHQSRTSHVLGNTQPDRNDLQRRDEILITDDRQPTEHVDRTDGVQDHCAVVQLCVGEQIVRVRFTDAGDGRAAVDELVSQHGTRTHVADVVVETVSSVAGGDC